MRECTRRASLTQSASSVSWRVGWPVVVIHTGRAARGVPLPSHARTLEHDDDEHDDIDTTTRRHDDEHDDSIGQGPGRPDKSEL